MIDADAPYRRNERWLLLLLLPLCYALFFHQLGARDIWDPDEDEYVLVNREMVLDGHWLYPTANGGPYSIKPPLFNWLGSGISVLAGEVDELTSRLPSAIAASVTKGSAAPVPIERPRLSQMLRPSQPDSSAAHASRRIARGSERSPRGAMSMA